MAPVKRVPNHREIYRTLVAEIAVGQYNAPQRLPSEAQLVQRFGVSRPTAARALRDLQSEGVVERRVGAGSFLRKGAKRFDGETSRQLGLLLPQLEVAEIFEVFCGELAGLPRATDYILVGGCKRPAKKRPGPTVNDADETCQ